MTLGNEAVQTVHVETAVVANRRHVVLLVHVGAAVTAVVEANMGGCGARRMKAPRMRAGTNVDKVVML